MRAPHGDVDEVAAASPRPFDDKVEKYFSDLSFFKSLVEVGDPTLDVNEGAFSSSLPRKNELEPIVCALLRSSCVAKGWVDNVLVEDLATDCLLAFVAFRKLARGATGSAEKA